MALDLSAYDAMLKDFYGPKVISLLNKRTKLLDLFTTNNDTSLAVEGRNVIYPIQSGRNAGVGAVGESKTLPVAGNQTTNKVTVPYRYNYARVQLTSQTIKASKTNKGAFKKSMEFEMKSVIMDLARSRNRQLWGFGVGILCRVSGNQGAGTSILMKDPYGVVGAINAARLLLPGDTVMFIRNATPTSAADSDVVGSSNAVTVSSISADGNTVTFTGTTGATLNDNDMVIMSPGQINTSGSVNREVMGLLGIIDDATYLTTLHGVSRVTVPSYKASVITLNGALSFDVLQRAEDLADEKGGDGIDVIMTHHSVRREYLRQLTVAKRFIGDAVANPDAGFTGAALNSDVEWNGHKWKAERMAPYGMIFGIDTDMCVRFVNAEGEWADDDGTILLRTSTDSYEGRFRIFDNFTNDRPDACFRIDGVTATIDAVSAE